MTFTIPVGKVGNSPFLSGVILRTLPFAIASRGTASWARPTLSVSLSELVKNLLTVRLPKSAKSLADFLSGLCVSTRFSLSFRTTPLELLFTDEPWMLSLTCFRKGAACREVQSPRTEEAVSVVTSACPAGRPPPLQEFRTVPASSRNGRRSECVECVIILSVLFQAWRSSIYILALVSSIKDDRGIYFLISLNVFSLVPLCSVNK